MAGPPILLSEINMPTRSQPSKKPLRKLAGHGEASPYERGPAIRVPDLTLFLTGFNMPTRSQPSKKCFQKAEKLPKDATKKSFERSAVFSADQFPPLTLEHHCNSKV